MKRSRFLALVLVVAVMLMGAGYAYWTDKIVIENTVETGKFEVVFVKQGWPNAYPRIFSSTGEKYMKFGIDHVDSKKTSVTVTNMYPGKTVRYEAKIQNTGSIPAVFDSATVTYGSDNTPGFVDVLQIQPFVTKYKADGTKYVKGEAGYWAGASLGWRPVANLSTNLNTIMAGCSLEPGEFITFDVPDEYLAAWQQENPGIEDQCIEIRLPGSVGTVQNPDEFETAKAKFDITINWKQHNAQ